MLQKITIINGNPNTNPHKLNTYLDGIYKNLSGKGIEVSYFQLKDEEINYCVGCWDCWWKTPGLCRFRDSISKILPEVINSDLVIYASPMKMGFYSTLLKKFHDRTVPLVHPYIKIIEGECHHKKRYPNYPKMGIILDSDSSDEESLKIAKDIFDRYAVNFHSEVSFFYTTENINEKELAHEISTI